MASREAIDPRQAAHAQTKPPTDRDERVALDHPVAEPHATVGLFVLIEERFGAHRDQADVVQPQHDGAGEVDLGGDEELQVHSRVERRGGIDVVPLRDLRHARPEEPADGPQRVARGDAIEHATSVRIMKAALRHGDDGRLVAGLFLARLHGRDEDRHAGSELFPVARVVQLAQRGDVRPIAMGDGALGVAEPHEVGLMRRATRLDPTPGTREALALSSRDTNRIAPAGRRAIPAKLGIERAQLVGRDAGRTGELRNADATGHLEGLDLHRWIARQLAIAEGLAVPHHDGARHDLGDVDRRLEGQASLELGQRPIVVGVVLANGAKQGAVAHVVGRQRELPAAEASM